MSLPDAPWKITKDLMRIDLNPTFDPQTLKDNLAMIRLASPVDFPFNDHINVPCLPDSNEVFVFGIQCVLSGWGPVGDGNEIFQLYSIQKMLSAEFFLILKI